jgi:tetratricopeptide (TPR) repeat protein
MNALRIPILLLVFIILLGVFFVWSSDPGKIKKSISLLPEIKKELEKTEDKQNYENILIKARTHFKNENFASVLSLMSTINDENNYEVLRLKSYSLAALKRFDEAILSFEKLLSVRSYPEDGYSLAYLYEVSGYSETSHGLYEELLTLDLSAALRLKVSEGYLRTSAYSLDEKKVIKVAHELSKRYPTSPAGIIEMLKLYNRPDKRVLSMIDNLSDHHRSNYEFNFRAGLYAYSNGYFDFAEKYFNVCIKIDSQNSIVYYYLYKLYEGKGFVGKSLEMIERFHSLSHVLGSNLFEPAVEASKQGLSVLAYNLYRSAVCADRRLLIQNDNGIIKSYQMNIPKNLDSKEVKFYQIFKKYLNGEYESAMSEMLTLLPELSGIAYIDGTNMVRECHAVRMQDVRYQKYIRDLELARIREAEAKRLAEEEAKKPKPKPPEDTPADKIKRMAVVNPTDYDAQYKAGVELSRLGYHKDAIFFFESAARLNKKALAPVYSMANLYLFIKDYDKANAMVLQALEISPADTSSLGLAAEIFLESSDTVKAIFYAKKAIKSNTNNLHARLILAQAYNSVGDFTNYRSELEKGLFMSKSEEAINEKFKILYESLQND